MRGQTYWLQSHYFRCRFWPIWKGVRLDSWLYWIQYQVLISARVPRGPLTKQTRAADGWKQQQRGVKTTVMSLPSQHTHSLVTLGGLVGFSSLLCDFPPLVDVCCNQILKENSSLGCKNICSSVFLTVWEVIAIGKNLFSISTSILYMYIVIVRFASLDDSNSCVALTLYITALEEISPCHIHSLFSGQYYMTWLYYTQQQQ